MRTHQRVLATVIVGLASATGCGLLPTASTDLHLVGGLRTGASCDRLLPELHSLGRHHTTAYGLEWGNWENYSSQFADWSEPPVDDGAAFPDVGLESHIASFESAATDGDRLVTTVGGRIRVFDITGITPVLTGEIDLADGFGDLHTGSIVLDGDRAYLLHGVAADTYIAPGLVVDGEKSIGRTRLTEVDLNAETVLASVDFEGRLGSFRRDGDVVRLVLVSRPKGLGFARPDDPDNADEILTRNHKLIEASSIEAWLPSYQIRNAGDVIDEGLLIDCERMHLPIADSGHGVVSSIAINIGGGLTSESIDPAASLGVLATDSHINVSADRLTIATEPWPVLDATGAPVDDPNYSTAIHTFDTTEPATSYVATGHVDGHVLDQNALSFSQGHVRVATTDSEPWGHDAIAPSSVSTLIEDDSILVPVGGPAELGYGGSARAVHFTTDAAYSVSFRPVALLTVVDLSDPGGPRVSGISPIPDNSTYLYPLPNELFIGLGRRGTGRVGSGETVEDDGPFIGSATVSLISVADPASAELIDTIDFGPDTGDALRLSQPSISWLSPASTAILEVAMAAPGDGVHSDVAASVVALEIPGTTIEQAGQISAHPALTICHDADRRPFVEPDGVEINGTPCGSHVQFPHEILVVDGRIYTVSASGIMVNDAASYEEISWISFHN